VTNTEIFQNTNLELDKMTGTHVDGRNDNDVNAIHIGESPNLVKIPKGIDVAIPSIIHLGIWNNRNFKEIHRQDLRPFRRLKGLFMDSNAFEVIEADLFEHNVELEIVWLHGNKIKTIDPFVFSQLASLRVLKLQGNNCGDALQAAVTKTDVEKVVRDIEEELCYQDVQKEFYALRKALVKSRRSLETSQQGVAVKLTMIKREMTMILLVTQTATVIIFVIIVVIALKHAVSKPRVTSREIRYYEEREAKLRRDLGPDEEDHIYDRIRE
jgi:hypothetical protein